MHPEINLSDYKAIAVIDWLDIAVTLGHTTQFQYVQPELHRLLGLSALDKPVHVTAQNVDKATDSATSFVFRLQEHHHDNNAAKIAHVLRGLAACFGFAAPARIVGIEVSFDLKPRNDPQAIYEAYAVLHGCIAAYGEDARQYAYSMRHQRGRMETITLETVFDPNGTLYVGHQDDKHGYQPTPKAYRVYAKVTDNGKPLPPEQHRARAEVTLQLGALEECGLADPLALASYDFTKLAGLLHFQWLKPPAEIAASYIAGVESDLLQAVKKRRKTGKRPPEDFLRRMRSRLTYRKFIAQGFASLARATDRVIDWDRGWEGTKDKLQHSKDTTPDAKLNRKVKAALEALSKTLAKGIYSPVPKKRA